MERGTDWEREAVRERWHSLERRRRATDQFLLGLLAAVVGLVLLGVAGARETCGFTIGGATANCSSVVAQPVVLAFGLLGVFAVVYGVRLCWTATHGT